MKQPMELEQAYLFSEYGGFPKISWEAIPADMQRDIESGYVTYY